jgi:hypothetical protein
MSNEQLASLRGTKCPWKQTLQRFLDRMTIDRHAGSRFRCSQLPLHQIDGSTGVQVKPIFP